MEGLWTEPERFLVESRLSAAAIGGPETVRQKLERLLRATGADELIFTSDLYDHDRRLRSFEIAAEAMKAIAGVECTVCPDLPAVPSHSRSSCRPCGDRVCPTPAYGSAGCGRALS